MSNLMTDTTDTVALRESALKATAGEWCADSQHSVIADAGQNANYYVAACSGPDSKINAKFIALANPATIIALLDQIEAERRRREAAEKERNDLLNQEFQQRLANAEHQLEMKDLAISNVKASRMAQFRKRKAAEAELERRDGLTGEMIYQERRFHVKGKSQIEYWADVNVSTYGYLHESQRRILYVAAGGIAKDGE
jgi:hypothetical protein